MKYTNFLILFFLGAFVQWEWSTHMAFWGISPQILLILTVAVASRGGPIRGQNFAFFWGLFLDLMGVHLFGVNVLVFTLVAFVVGMLHRQMDISSPLSQITVVWLITIMYYIFIALVGLIFEKHFFWIGWPEFFFGPLLNCLITPIGFYLVGNLIRA